MMQYIKRNRLFFLWILSSLICFILLLQFFGLGIALGSIFIYQGINMIIPNSDVGIYQRLKVSFLITGLIIGPLYTVIYIFLCLDCIFAFKKFDAFDIMMGFTDANRLKNVACIEYSVGLALNVVYFVILYKALKRFQGIQNDAPLAQRRNVQNDFRNESRDNQLEMMYYNNPNNNNNNLYFSQLGRSEQNDDNELEPNQGNINNINNNYDNAIRQNSLFAQNQQRQFNNFQDLLLYLNNIDVDFENGYDDSNGENINRQMRIRGEEVREETIKSSVFSRDAQSQDQGQECAICYEEFDKLQSIGDKRLIQLTCNHTFHSTCIRNSIKSIGLKCPYCRSIITQHISMLNLQNRQNIVWNVQMIYP